MEFVDTRLTVCIGFGFSALAQVALGGFGDPLAVRRIFPGRTRNLIKC